MAQFICLHEGFCHYFDAVIDKLCLGMTFHPAKYFTVTRKQKVNRLILRGVTWDEMYMFISLLIVMGFLSEQHTSLGQVKGSSAEGVKCAPPSPGFGSGG